MSQGVLVHKKGSGLVCNFWHYWCCWNEYVGIFSSAANVLARYLNCHTFARNEVERIFVWSMNVGWCSKLATWHCKRLQCTVCINYIIMFLYVFNVFVSLLLLIIILSLVSLRGCWLSNVQERHPAILSAWRGPPRGIVLCWRGMALRLGVKRRKYGRLSAIFQQFPTGIREAQTNQCKNEPNCLESLESEFSINNHDTWVH